MQGKQDTFKLDPRYELIPINVLPDNGVSGCVSLDEILRLVIGLASGAINKRLNIDSDVNCITDPDCEADGIISKMLPVLICFLSVLSPKSNRFLCGPCATFLPNFCENRLSSFCIILLKNKQTN